MVDQVGPPVYPTGSSPAGALGDHAPQAPASEGPARAIAPDSPPSDIGVIGLTVTYPQGGKVNTGEAGVIGYLGTT
jgi:hypothetical protein